MTEEPDTGEFPITGHHWGQPLPDLRLIDRERWVDALAPLEKPSRIVALSNCHMHELDDEMVGVFVELMLRDGQRSRLKAEEFHRATPPPAGRVESKDVIRERRRYAAGGRQINLRFGPEDYRSLARAADEHGLKPTQLARLLVVNGLRRIEYERRRLSGP